MELSGADDFFTDYADQLGDPDGPVGFHVIGPCPSCLHLTSDVFPLKVVGTGPVSRGTTPDTIRFGLAPEDETTAPHTTAPHTTEPHTTEPTTTTPHTTAPVPVIAQRFYGLLSCRCPTVHFPPVGAPAGSKPAPAIGCGAYWMAAATLDGAGAAMTIGPADTEVAARAWSAAKAAGDSAPVALTAIRANASKWQTSMTAVLGLLAVTGLVGGRAVLQTLSGWSALLIGSFATVSLLTNVWSILVLTSAASGRARLRPSGNIRQLEAADLEPLRQARRAEKQFGHGLLLVVASFSSALVALLLVWLVPAAASPTVDVTVEVGATARSTCGTISIDPGGGTFTVTPRDLSDGAQTYPIAQLAGIGAPC